MPRKGTELSREQERERFSTDGADLRESLRNVIAGGRGDQGHDGKPDEREADSDG